MQMRKRLNKNLFEKALTLANNDKQSIPLNSKYQSETASLSLGRGAKQKFQTALEAYGVSKHFFVSDEITSAEIAAQVSKLAAYKTVIVSVHNMSKWKSKNFGFSASELELLQKLQAKTNVVLVVFGSPYSLVHFNAFPTILVAYEENDYTQNAAAKALFGQLPLTGTLPVSAGKFKVNDGVNLSFTKPMYSVRVIQLK
jgi:beta-N-acetylhexosaminidase